MGTKRVIALWLLLPSILMTAAFMASAQESSSALANPPIKTIHVVASSHWNLGNSSNESGGTFPYRFSVPPEVVKLDAKAHVDEVLDTSLKNNDFYWTIEALWMFQAWWDNTPDPARREQMLRMVRENRVTLSAPTHQYRSAFLAGEEVNRTIYDAERLRRDYQLPIDTAIMNDVPGWNWSLVQPLKKSGVKYFLAGPNNFIGGALKLAPKDIPFWWQGPDGSRILTWVCIGNYTEGQTRVYINPSAGRFFAGMGYSMPGVSLDMEDSERKKVADMNDTDLMEYNIGLEMERLRKGNYPYDSILVMYSHDTQGPDNIVGTMKYIRDWNARHKYPQIVLSTPHRFFSHLEETYGPDAFPVFSGDWAGLWETTSCPNPLVRAQVRYSQEFAPVLEKFSSVAQIIGKRPYPVSDLKRINAQVLENSDQGMPNGLAAPLSVYQSTKGLYQATLSLLVQDVATSTPAVVVFNPASAKRTDVVRSPLLKDLAEKNLALLDSITGKSIPWQKTDEKHMQFIAPDVPPLGYKVFLTSERPSDTEETSTVDAPDASTIENEFYRVKVNPQTGDIASIFDKQAAREMVDNATSYSLNGLCDSPRGMWGGLTPVTAGSAQTTTTVAGGTARISIRRENALMAASEISLHAGVRRIDISNRLKIAEGTKLANGYYLTFPFALKTDALVPRIENANAFLTPGGGSVKPTYLDGAYTGAFIATRSTELHEGDAYGIALALRQSNDVAFDSTTSTVFLKIFTPEDNSNPTDTEFPRELQFDYAVTSYAGAFNPAYVKDFSEAFVLPFWGDHRPASGRPGELFKAPAGPLGESQLSFLEISAPNVKLSAWKQTEQGDAKEYLLRFQEVAGLKKTDVTAKSRFGIQAAVLANMVEQPLDGGKALPTDPLRFAIGANETVSIRVKFASFARNVQ